MSDAVIHRLPELVINQIAAGEVIERPASVVKELVENALDAGAGHVQVDLEEGGAKLVRVSDDGVGMVADDLALAFEPHATSKLRDASDLDHIASLGFRGEALASMGSVARCAITTRRRDAQGALRLANEGGRRGDVEEVGAPRGTTVEVRDLFYNTPARRRFLKRPSTELSRCLDVVQRAALGQLGVGFVATHDSRRVFDVEAGMDLLARIRRTFGAELAEALVPVEAEDGSTRVFGFVAPPRFSRRDTARQMWFLNGRSVKDRVLLRCLKEAYRGFLVEGRQPVAFLHLAMDPALVDVNVHPAKAEVRFRDDRRLFGFLVNALRAGVSRTDMATPGEALLQRAAARDGLSLRDRRASHPGQSSFRDGGGLGVPRDSEPFVVREVPGEAPRASAAPRAVPPLVDLPDDAMHAPAAEDRLRGPFLQVARTYLVRALPDGFEVVDQHALHERITYEGLLRDLREGRVEVQRLLVPEVVEVSRSELELLLEHRDALARIGIELDAFGETDVAVHGLPARLRHPDAAGVVRDLADLLARTGKAPDAADVIEEVLHRASCRSSCMAGDALSEDEIRALLERGRELGAADQTCPHARPTRVRFTLDDLERAFHRK
ncbi:MAG: DNA mismatch repair endonuclease MutL [Planctomycetes bacterium]|nr:DNA mismatch repair endonuclease MutL [Planctomycetota bacterium]